MSIDRLHPLLDHQGRELERCAENYSEYVQTGRRMDIVMADHRGRESAPAVIGADLPVRNKAQDAFGFSVFAAELVAQVADPGLEMPLAICIDGSWGSGKSSLARLMFERLRSSEYLQIGCLPVWIDTSRMLGTDALRLVGEAIWSSGDRLARRLLGERDELGLEGEVIIPISFARGNSRAGARNRKKLERRLRSYAASWRSRWPEDNARVWTLQLVVELVRDVRYALLGGGGISRLVLFIDDLDRCAPEGILGLLDLNRALLHQRGLVKVFSMDYQIVSAVVGRSFLRGGGRYQGPGPTADRRTAETQGSMYLEKFFGARVRPPAPSDLDITRWVDHLLGQEATFDGLGAFLQLAYFGNPRSIRRFVSAVKLLQWRYRAARAAREASDERSGVRSDWDAMIELLDSEEEGLRLLSKIGAFAFASQLRPFYEIARMPDPRRLQEVELAGRSGARIRLTALGPGGLREIEASVPEELAFLMRTGPSLVETSEAVLLSAILAMESVLPAPTLKWRPPSAMIEEGEAEKLQHSGFGDGAPPRASISERKRTAEIVDGWREALESEGIKVPEKIRNNLGFSAGDHVVEVFRDNEWEPSTPELVVAGTQALFTGDKDSCKWLLAAAAVHEEWDGQDVDAVATALSGRIDSDFLAAVFELSSDRLPDDEEVKLRYARSLIAVGGTEETRIGLEKCLELLRLSRDELIAGRGELPEGWLEERRLVRAFLAASDAFWNLKDFEGGVELATCAIRTPEGPSAGPVLRNLGRALWAAGHSEDAARVYGAAVMVDASEVTTLSWWSLIASEPATKLLLSQAALLRAPHDGEHWLRCGVQIHNLGAPEAATAWLRRAQELKPGESEVRTALAQNVAITMGQVAAATALKGEIFQDALPEEKVDAMILECGAAFDHLKGEIDGLGRVEWQGVVLYEPGKPAAEGAAVDETTDDQT